MKGRSQIQKGDRLQRSDWCPFHKNGYLSLCFVSVPQGDPGTRGPPGIPGREGPKVSFEESALHCFAAC